MSEQTITKETIDIWNDYPGMVFWEDAVVYLVQRFSDFDVTALEVTVDEQTLFDWKLSYSYDNINWSNPKPIDDWKGEAAYLAENGQYGDMKYVWVSIWITRHKPNHTQTGTMYLKKDTDTRISILRIGSITYRDEPLNFNDEAVANIQPFFEVIAHFPKWNFYDNQQINIRRWLDMCWSTTYSYGHVGVWFKTLPVESATVNTFANHVMRNVVAIKKIMIASPGNEIPSEKQVFTEWDMPLMDDFVIHVVDEVFKDTFGFNTVPLQKDYLYIPMLDRLFKVSNVQPGDKRFMGKVGWWECYLAKYEEDSTVNMAPGLKESMSKYAVIDDALDEFSDKFNIIEELEQFTSDTVLSEERISNMTADEKRAANDNYSNRLTDSTGFIDLKDTETQRAAYSKRLNILTVNPDGNALFPINMYNCGDLGQREVAMTYDLRDAVATSGNSLRVTETMALGFDFVAQGKFNGELFDLHPAMTVSFTRALKMSVTFHNNQAVNQPQYVFLLGEYYRIEIGYTRKINQLSVNIFMLVNGQKTPVWQDIYIVNKGMETDPFGVSPDTLIMYGGQWLAGNIEYTVDAKMIIKDSVIPILVMNKFGL
jgi:hypothetical protein